MRFLLMIVCLALGSSAFAQETKKTKKVVVIKKSDTNGKVTEDIIEATGEEADELIKKMKENGEFKGIDIQTNGDKSVKIIQKKDAKITINSKNNDIQNLEVESTVNQNGDVLSSYTLTKEIDGKKEVIKWDGNGEPPAEIKAALEETQVNTIIMSDRDDVEDVEVIVMTDNINRNDDDVWISEKDEFIKENKATLGVIISDNGNGVIVDEILKDSAADKSGLQKLDVILKINNTYIFSLRGLLEALSPYEGGEEIKVTYLREGKERSTSAVLQAK